MKSCCIPDCDTVAKQGRYCYAHYWRLRTYGRLHLIRRPNGTGYKRPDGYIEIMDKGKKKMLHRLVMEQHLGRKLLVSELVHHINGNPSDNSIKNLSVMSKKDHTKMHLTKHDGKQKKCIECRKVLPLSLFYLWKRTGNYRSYCHPCFRGKKNQWYHDSLISRPKKLVPVRSLV